MREGIGLLHKCMLCKNVQMGLGKSKREWTALFYINWTNNLWKNENIYYRAFKILSVLPPCLAMAEVVLGGTISKFSMGIFVWCNVSFATSWSEEARLDAPRRKPPTLAWQHTCLRLRHDIALQFILHLAKCVFCVIWGITWYDIASEIRPSVSFVLF